MTRRVLAAVALLVLLGAGRAAAAQPKAAIDLGVSAGFTTDESLDDLLAGLGYDGSTGVLGGDLTAVFGLTDWLFAGGRALVRGRDWPRAGEAPATATGVGVLAVVEARLAVRPSVDFVLSAGAGGGGIGLRLNDGNDAGAAPAGWLGLALVSAVDEHAGVFARFGYEYFEAVDLGGRGYDLNLSGGTLALGVEVRP